MGTISLWQGVDVVGDACRLVVIAVVASSSAPASVGTYEFNPVLAVPYFVVLILAMTGMNVLLVPTIGIGAEGFATEFPIS